jgi:hypothetical protein
VCEKGMLHAKEAVHAGTNVRVFHNKMGIESHLL